ncbi:nuclease [bacterium]|nr:MAG: nuclease [bacterium]
MVRVLVWAGLGWIAAGCASPSGTAKQEPTASGFAGQVVSVADGDTFTLRTESGKKVKVRLWGVDAPERDQAFGLSSRRFLERAVAGRTVRIEVREKDRYERSVASVMVDGASLNRKALEQGMAWWYRRYAPEEEGFENAERAARRAKLGLWRDRKPVAPWEFRRR